MTRSTEPLWVTKTLRLFPRPLFAFAVSSACFLVAAIFAIGAIVKGEWFFFAGTFAFGGTAITIVTATIVRRIRTHSMPKGGERFFMTDAANELEGIRPVPTWHLLLYLATVLIWEFEITAQIVHAVGGNQIIGVWSNVLSIANVFVSFVAFWFARSDIKRIRMSGGKVQVTRTQAIIIAIVFISIGATAVVAYEMVKDKL